MKRYVEKDEEETTTELSKWVGIVFDDGIRGVILYIGDSYHIINSNIGEVSSNACCGARERDGDDIESTINNWINNAYKGSDIKDILCFDSYKEQMQWFVDGIKD